MTPTEMIAKLDALHREGKFFGLTIWPTNAGLQCNLATTSKNNWRIRRADTPSEGLALVLDMDFVDDELPRTPAELLGEGEMLAPPTVDEPELPHDETGIFD
jgi:hypothetical protein